MNSFLNRHATNDRRARPGCRQQAQRGVEASFTPRRTLLVSHWAVNSSATVSFPPANKATGRAVAMQESMLALIDHGGPPRSASGILGAFVLVGNGGTSQ